MRTLEKQGSLVPDFRRLRGQQGANPAVRTLSPKQPWAAVTGILNRKEASGVDTKICLILQAMVQRRAAAIQGYLERPSVKFVRSWRPPWLYQE